MVEVILYTKEGCHLCEEVKTALGRLTAVHPHHLTEVDITQDPDIFARYHYTIPVVRIDEMELEAPITIAQLQSTLVNAAISHE